jgi:outer membrane protein TolC
MKRLRWALFGLLVAYFARASDAITLQTALQRTLENNPEIQKAKCDLEGAGGRRLVFHAVALPDAKIGVVGGVEGGRRAGQKAVQEFGFGYGGFTQPFFNMAVPASWRRGDFEVLIAQQQLQVAVVEQLHQARLAFYTAIYNRDLQRLRTEQQARLKGNVGSQKDRYQSGLVDRGALVSAEVEMSELGSPIETARRAYEGALVQLRQSMGDELGAGARLLQPEGELDYAVVKVDLAEASSSAIKHRPDLELARLLVRAAAEDQRILEAAYYPEIHISVSGEYIPVSSVRRTQGGEGSPRRSDDIISSEIRSGGAYTWRVIDNGKVGGAVARQNAVRETNELLLRKMERDLPRDLFRIENDLESLATKQNALVAAKRLAEENATTLEQNVKAGVASQLEFRLAQNDLLDVKTGLLGVAYKQHVDLAEWDRTTGKYLRFLDETTRSVP